MPRLRRRPYRLWCYPVWLAVLLSVLGCGKTAPEKTAGKTGTGQAKQQGDSPIDFAALRPKIDKFCGDCHAVPDPATFPKKAWYDEVAQGYRFYDESRRSGLVPPPMNSVVAYYRHFAPEKLSVPQVKQTDASSQFTIRDIPLLNGKMKPSVSHLYWQNATGTNSARLLFCDMQSGEVSRVDLSAPSLKTERVARLNHPAHIHPVKFRGDVQAGFVVAELGTFLPGDHTKGRITWLRSRKNGNGYDAIVLKSGLGRVADVRPADFDGDGKIDLIVAEFGWRKTGRILLLKQTGRKDGVPRFETIVIDKRHGTIHVPVVDLNRDGRPDFVALVSQEYEAVDAFINLGNGQFERRRLYQAKDPSFGSSGIQVVDLDGDGDLDVLYTNGDSLDSHYLKPYHAVHWLENKGAFPFTHHEITRLPGAARAVAADLDGDGDLDIACAAYLPSTIIDRQTGGKIDSLIWLEQKEKGKFVRHGIERSSVGYLSLIAGDFDGDGTPDLATGFFQASNNRIWVRLWRNRAGKTTRRK